MYDGAGMETFAKGKTLIAQPLLYSTVCICHIFVLVFYILLLGAALALTYNNSIINNFIIYYYYLTFLLVFKAFSNFLDVVP